MAANYFDQFDEPAQPQGGNYFDRFDAVEDQPVPPRSGPLSAVSDSALALGGGVVRGVKALADVAGPDNAVSRGLGAAAEWTDENLSPERKAEMSRRGEIIRRAEESGSTMEQIGAHIGAFAEAPIDTTLSSLGFGAPIIASAFIPGGAGAASARMAAPVALGAAQGVGNVKGQIYDEVKAYLLSRGVSEEDAEQRALEAQSYDGPNKGSLALAAGLGAAAGGTGVERIATGMMGRRVAAEAAENVAEQSALRAAAHGALAEAPMEMLQGGQERLAQNLALREEGSDVPTWRGVVAQGVAEGVAAAPVGAAFGVAGRSRVTRDPAIEALDTIAPAQTTDEAIKAAGRALDSQTLSEAVLNAERAVEVPDVGTSTEIPSPDSGASGGRMDLGTAGLENRAGADGFPAGAVDTGGPAVEPVTADLPQTASPAVPAGAEPDALSTLTGFRVPARPAADLPGGQAQGVAPEAAPATVEVTRRADGSMVLKGDTKQIMSMLAAQGLVGVPSRSGVRVAKSGARDALELVEKRGPLPSADAVPEVTQVVPSPVVIPPAPAPRVRGARIDREWNAFTPQSGTRGVPRAEMPQIKAEHRGAMTNFLNARGIQHEQVEVPARDLKPTQAEFSPAKVERAKSFEGGDRSILISADGHILDGHHQWLAKLEAGEPVKAIRLDAPIDKLLAEVKEFPSATTAAGAMQVQAKTEEEKKDAEERRQQAPQNDEAAAPPAADKAPAAAGRAAGQQPRAVQPDRAADGRPDADERAAVAGDRRAAGRGPDRRQDAETRRRVQDMDAEELRRALLTHELTGIQNRRAWEDADKKANIASIDADSLKWLNDNMSPEDGDALLREVAYALSAHLPEADIFHISGDEFIAMAEDARALRQAMARVQEMLDNAVITREKPDGTVITKTGLSITTGYGKDKADADQDLKREKLDREARGERAGRGETPPGVRRQPAGVPAEPGAGRQGDGDRGSTARPRSAVGAPAGPLAGQARDTVLTQTPADAGVSDSGDGAFARGAPVWRSALRDGIAAISAKAQGGDGWRAQIQGLVNKGAAKADEVEWSGITDWLKLQPGKVTKEDVLEYLDANGVQVNEVVLSDIGADMERATVSNADEAGTIWHIYGEDGEPVGGSYSSEADAWDDLDKMRSEPRSKYGQYTLPGGENYREVLLTLPTPAGQAQDRIKKTDTELRNYLERHKAFSRNGARDYALEAAKGTLTDGQMRFARSDDRQMRLIEAQREAWLEREKATGVPSYQSGHFDQQNVLAHIRLNDRNDAEGKRVLFVEEVQSDWAQEGKKRGFSRPRWTRSEERRVRELEQPRPYPGLTVAERTEFDELMAKRETPGLPAAPFVGKTDAWVSLALKRIITMAANEGYDRVAFVNGEQSAERYDLSKQINSIEVVQREPVDGQDNGRVVYAKLPNETLMQFTIDSDGDVVGVASGAPQGARGQHLSDVLGKELAERIMQVEGRKTFEGLDLKVGGEGMKAFYDQIVPTAVKKLLPRINGGKASEVTFFAEPTGREDPDTTPITEDGEIEYRQLGFDITPAMREKAAQGLPMFARGLTTDAFRRAFAPPAAMTVQRARQLVGDMTAKWTDGPRFTVVATAADLPMDAPADTRGWVSSSGRGYIVAANNPNREALARTLAHEAIGHYGLWKMLGDDGRRRFERNVQLALRGGNKRMAEIREKVRSAYLDEDGEFNLTPEQEANEIAAFTVEEGVDPATGEFRPGFGWLKQFWTRIKAFLRDTLGLKVFKFSDADLQVMLLDSMRGLQAGQRLDGGADVLVAAARSDQPVQVPDVVVGHSLGAATGHKDYAAAKAGDVPAAVRLARDLVTPDLVSRVRKEIGDAKPLILPVISEEATGRNKIPLATAQVLGDKLGLDTVSDVVQANRPHRTGMDGLDRLFAVPEFDGAIEPGRDYLLVDDTVTQGATFAALASHIQQGGGNVVGAVALTGKQYSARMEASDKTLQQLRAKHGDLEDDFRAATGYGFDALTQSEARYLANYEPTQRLRDRVAAEGRRARDAGSSQAPGGLDSALARGAAPPPSTPEEAGSGKSNAWSLPADTRLDRFIYELQDTRIDLKRIQQAVEKSGQKIDEQWDVSTAETLYPGRVAHRSQQFLEAEVAPLLKSMAVNKITMDEMADYLHARGAEERNAQIAKVNPDMPDGGAGKNTKGVLMTNKAAREYLATISQSRKKALEAVARRVDAITKGTRDLLVAEGLEKRATVEAWEKTYPNYVPMFRDDVDAEGVPHPQGTGFSVKGTSSKRATGSTKEVTNILSHVLMQREAAITRAEKNRVALANYGLALTQPNPEVWTTIRPSMSDAQIEREMKRMGVDPEVAMAGMERAPVIRTVGTDGTVVERPNPAYKNLPGAIVVKVNGEDRVLMYNTSSERGARLATSLKNLDGLTNFDLAGSIVGQATRWLAAVNTQYNPAFGLVNLVRDVLGATINLGSTRLRGDGLKVLGGTVPAIRAIAAELRKPGSGGATGKLWQQFQADGGKTGWKENWRDPNERARALEKELKAAEKAGKLTPGKVAHAALDLLDGFNTTLENAVRLSAYKSALDKGQSRAQAAKLARELTVDFNRKGRLGRELGPLYAFFNASVQGTARTLQTLKGPTGRRVIAGGLGLGVLQALALASAGYDDDELQEFTKSRAFIIPMGLDQEGKKVYAQIPLPLGLHVLPNTGRILTELLMSGGEGLGEKSFKAIAEVAAAMNPLGGGDVTTMPGFLTTLAPTVVDPAIELVTNKNFAGNDIERESFSETDTRPGTARARESTLRSTTGQVYTGIAEAINALTGGSRYEAGLASPTPERVRYLAQTVGGGVLRELEKIVNGATGDEPVKPHQIPVAGRFYGAVDDEQVQTSRYYRTKEKVEQLRSTYNTIRKAGDAEAMAQFIRDNPEVMYATLLSRIQRDITKLNKLAVTSIGDPAEMKAIDEARADLMKSANQAIEEMERARAK